MERWLPVPGYEGLYEVSDTGRLRSVRRTGTLGGIKQTPLDGGGYPHTSLCKGGRQATYRLHQLVALAFIGPCPNGIVVRHLDGNPANNALANLAYGTQSDNNSDAVRHGTHWLAARTHCRNGHEYTPENTYMKRKPNGDTSRACRACTNARSSAWHARKRAERATKEGSSAHSATP